MAEVKFEKVKKSFKDVMVIRELDLTIEDGEFFTFVGPSGCGKSTILNMVAGLEPLTGGRIYFDNILVNELSPKDRDVAMVFQTYALYPHMTVYENIAFPLKMKKLDAKIVDREVKRIVGILGLEEFQQRKPKELSGGQRQRVALGRAIIRRPKVFLMDEPLSNLDARLRIEMRAELKRIHQDLKITTIYVTHDQGEAMSLSDKIAVLLQGEIQQSGKPLDVYLKPANIFVGGFIGSPPMNFLTCSLQNLRPVEVNCNGLIFSPIMEDMPKKGVIMGIRPEDVSISVEPSGDSVEVSVSLVEPAGSFNWVDAQWGRVKIKGTAKVNEDLKAGSRAFMKFSVEKVTVFDAVSGKRL